jgi:nucleoside-diphosphate-sugar epimerase
MKILVTGGLGMLGSNVVRALRERGEDRDVAVADINLSREQDLRDKSACLAVTEGVERIFHIADHTVGIGYSSKHHGEMLTNSLLISLNLLEAARINGAKDYLYVSSSCVYADSDDPVEESLGTESCPERANEGYGWAKRIGELQARYYAREYGIRTIIARPANLYGPSYDWSNPNPHVIPSLIAQMLSGKKEIATWGSGEQTRTFMYERDAARILIELMEHGESGEAYNLGGQETQIKQVGQILADHCGYSGKLNFDTTKPEGPRRKAYNTEKISGLVRGIAVTSLSDGLKETFEAARRALQRGTDRRAPDIGDEKKLSA